MNTIDSCIPVLLPPDLVARLDPISSRDIVAHLILSGDPKQAWRVLTLTDIHLSDVLYRLCHNFEQYGHTAQSMSILIAPLGIIVGQGLLAEVNDNLTLRPLGLQISSWLAQSDEFIQGMLESTGHPFLLSAALRIFDDKSNFTPE